MTIDERLREQDAPTVRVPPPRYRWILVRGDGAPAHMRASYPDERTALRFAEPGERPQRMRVTSSSGPFSDLLEPAPETKR